MANTTELADVESGKDALSACSCGHPICAHNREAGIAGTAERGMS
jgi:hypothetical protein